MIGWIVRGLLSAGGIVAGWFVTPMPRTSGYPDDDGLASAHVRGCGHRILAGAVDPCPEPSQPTAVTVVSRASGSAGAG